MNERYVAKLSRDERIEFQPSKALKKAVRATGVLMAGGLATVMLSPVYRKALETIQSGQLMDNGLPVVGAAILGLAEMSITAIALRQAVS